MDTILLWLKRISRSKTMWLSAIGSGLVALESSFGLLQPFVPGNVYAWIAVGLSVGGAIIRPFTTKPLSEK